jgi:hypothetical protein
MKMWWWPVLIALLVIGIAAASRRLSKRTQLRFVLLFGVVGLLSLAICLYLLL